MKVSIITSVYNNRDSIAQAIESVLNQTYSDIEYIVIDGASTDGTVDIIKSYEDSISIFISEPDNGIYDGLNKGIHLATGDIIGFLHSDDFYFSNTVIEEIVNIFQERECDGVYGDLVYVDNKNTNRVIRYWKSGEFKYKNLKEGWMPPHPAFFLKKEVYNKYGGFDINFKISADYNFILKIFKKRGFRAIYIPKIIYIMRVGGISNRNIKNVLKKSIEDFKALKKNHIGGIVTVVKKNIFKMEQFRYKDISKAF
jgi:glycosyltransferase